MSENTAANNQYLTFTLDQEAFALDIESVREVLELTHITRVPRTPDYLRGVINLRGHAAPVVDLRMKFGMPRTQDTVNTCIIIVEVDMGGEATVLGALVDSVREVFEMGADTIVAPPRMGLSVRTDFIKGMGRQDQEFIMILDVNRIFSEAELAVLSEAGEAREAREAPAGFVPPLSAAEAAVL